MEQQQLKIKIIRVFSFIMSIFLLFWWPLSHLFYSDWYHQILGFSKGSYQPSMVIVIGITGFLPVMQLLIIGLDPVKYKANIVSMMIFLLLLALMYIYLIVTGAFPYLEFFNVAASLFGLLVYGVVTPWKAK
jgi:hypothetical protein